MSGVVRGVAESFVPEKTYPWGGGEYIVCAAPTHDYLPRDERLMKPPHRPVHWPYRRHPRLLNFSIDTVLYMHYSVLVIVIQYSTAEVFVELFINNHASKPIYEQISDQIKALIINGELKPGDAIPSIRSMAKSLHISVLTVQKAYDSLQTDGFIETTAGKGCFVSAQNQDFYLEEQQKKIEEHFSEAIEIARCSGIKLDKLTRLLTLLYEED